MAAAAPSGWVWKADTKVSHWQKRWFSLDGMVLNSFKKDTDKKPKKSFDLSAIGEDMLDYNIGSGAAPPTEFTLCVKTHTRMLNVAFDTKDDMDRWRAVFEGVRESLFPSGPSAEELAAKAKAEEEARAKAEAEAKAKADAEKKAAVARANKAADAAPYVYEATFTAAPYGLGLLPPRSGQGPPLVEAVREKTPAEELGTIMKGDKLVAFDGEDTKEMKYDDLLKAMKKAGKKIKKNPVTVRFERNVGAFVDAGKGRGAEIGGCIIRVRFNAAEAPYTCTLKDGKVGEYLDGPKQHKVVFDDGSEGVFDLNTTGHHLFTKLVFEESDDEDEEESKS